MVHTLNKDYAWNLVGTFLQSAISPILLVIVTRLNGIDDSGIISYAIAVSVVFWAIGVWGGRTFQVSDLKGEYKSGSYITLRLVTSLIMITGSVLFCLLNQYDFFKVSTIITMVLVKALEAISDSIYGVIQRHEKLYLTGISLTIKSVLSLISFFIIDYIYSDFAIAAYSLVAVNMLVILIYDLPIMRSLERMTIDLKTRRLYVRQAMSILAICTPIFAVIFMTMFALNIPRYFLDAHHPVELGYFGIMAMPITLLALLIMSIIQPKITELSRLLNKKQLGEFGRVVYKINLTTLAVGAVTWLLTLGFGVCVLGAIFGVNFDGHKTELLIMVFGAVFNALSIVYINILIVMRRFKEQFFILLSSNAILLVISQNLVNNLSIMGAVIAFAGISIVQSFLLFIAYNLYLRSLKTV